MAMAAWAIRAATGTTVRSLYNRTVNNFGNVHITNVYNRTVINNTTTHVSFNGGQGGISARPTAQQLAYQHAQHTPPTAVQTQHQQAASSNHALLASVNNGRPPIAATSRPGDFTGTGVVPARSAGGPVHLGAGRARDPGSDRSAAWSTGTGDNAASRHTGRRPGAADAGRDGPPGRRSARGDGDT